MNRILMACVATTALLLTAQAAEKVKSGPQVGDKVPGPFEPLNLTGDSAGERACLFCRYGTQPVAMVFARELTPATTMLLQKLDAACTERKDQDMASFVVFLADGTSMNDKLKAMAKDAKLQHVVVSCDDAAGPKEYEVNKDAEVTVVLYKDRIVKANRSFRKGELTEEGIQSVLAELPKIAAKK